MGEKKQNVKGGQATPKKRQSRERGPKEKRKKTIGEGKNTRGSHQKKKDEEKEFCSEIPPKRTRGG